MKKLKKIILILLTIAILMQPIMSALSVYAAGVGGYDNTTIESDLGDKVSEYHKQASGDCQIIYFMEYAYTEKQDLSKNYGLYFYVYNPTGKPISILDDVNAVNILIGNGKANNGAPDKIYLEYLDKTDDNLIYKFKLANANSTYLVASEYAREHEGKRTYTITELEVKYASGIKAYAANKKYEFTGYGAYLGNDDSPESTLQCLDYTVESINLNVKQTNYRGDLRHVDSVNSELLNTYYEEYDYIADDVSSVYFRISDRYYNQLNLTLSGVSAEWYEYKTQPIYVTSDADAYNNLYYLRNTRINQSGQRIDSNGSVIDATPVSFWRILFGETYEQIRGTSTDNYYYFKNIFNATPRGGEFEFNEFFVIHNNYVRLGSKLDSSWTAVNKIDWIFPCGDLNSENPYMVPRSALLSYMQEYSNTFGSHDIRGKYSSNLFVDSIDSDRISLLDANIAKDAMGNYIMNADGTYQLVDGASATNGLVKMHFKNTDNNSFVDASSTQSAWNKFFFGTKYESVDFSPIVTVIEGDLSLDDAAFAEKYKVNTQDVPDIKKELQSASSSNEKLVLLRFAVTDYTVKNARFDFVEEGTQDFSEQDGYVAQETAFLDFDVISLEFSDREGIVREIVGVVAEPIDIIHGLTPPDSLVEDEEWWQKLVGLILVVIILLVLYFVINVYVPWLGAIIRWVAGAFWWLFTSILKLITWPLRSLFSKASRKVKRKLNIRSPRGKGRRGRPKKEARNKRMMRNASGEIKAKASETISSAKQKLLEKIADIKNKNKEE